MLESPHCPANSATTGPMADSRDRDQPPAGLVDIVLATDHAPTWADAPGLRCFSLNRESASVLPELSSGAIVLVDAALLATPDPEWVGAMRRAVGYVIALGGSPDECGGAHSSGVDATLPKSLLQCPEDLARTVLSEVAVRCARGPSVSIDLTRDALHEVRTPLTVMIEFAELCREGVAGPLTEKQVEYLDRIVSAGDRLREQLEDYETLSRSEAGVTPTVAAQEDVGPPLQDVLSESLGPTDVVFEPRSESGAVRLHHRYDAAEFAIVMSRLAGMAQRWSRGDNPPKARLLPGRPSASERVIEFVYAGVEPSANDQVAVGDGRVKLDDGRYASVTKLLGLGFARARAYLAARGGGIELLARRGVGGTIRVRVPTSSPETTSAQSMAPATASVASPNATAA